MTREVLWDEATTFSKSYMGIHGLAEDFFLIFKCNYLKSLTNAYRLCNLLKHLIDFLC